MNTCQTLKAKIDNEVQNTMIQPVPDVVDVFKYCISKGGAGIPNDNQIFTTWFFGGADINYLADYSYFLIKLAKNDEFTMPQLRKMARFWVLQPAEFGNYCGLKKQWEFAKEFNALLDNIGRDEFIALLDSYRNYLANINAWIYHFIPWGVGFAFPRKDRKYYEEGLALISSL